MSHRSRQVHLLFGTAGVPPSTPQPSSVQGVQRVRALGLDCMELAFVRSVTMGDRAAEQVERAAGVQQVQLSVHAPYYINLNSDDLDKVRASRERILKAARVGWKCGARHIVFHVGYYQEYSADLTYSRVQRHLIELCQQLDSEGIRLWLRPETTGKQSQFGSLEELLDLSSDVEGVAPCIDFAHLHARSGKDNSYDEFTGRLRYIENKLGRSGLENMHIHVSGIEYGQKGERRHLLLEESDLRYEALLQALIDHGAKGRVICESPNTEQDALLLQRIYRQLSGDLTRTWLASDYSEESRV